MTTAVVLSSRSAVRVARLLLVVAATVAVLSALLGLAPFTVEPVGAADPVNCGPTWFRGSGLAPECYSTVDVWAVVAKAGLVLAAALAIGAGALWAANRRRGTVQH